MARLHLSLPRELAEAVRQHAAAHGQSVFAYLAELVRSQIDDDWPERYFERVVGGWVCEPLRRPEQRDVETRH